MAVVGVLETTPSLIAAINTHATGSMDHNFPPSSIWGHVFLQSLRSIDSEDGGADTYVSQVRDATGTHNVHWIGVFRNQCIRVRYTVELWDCWARALCVTHFFG